MRRFTPPRDLAYQEGVSSYWDGDPRKVPAVWYRYENATEVVSRWLEGWDLAEFYDTCPDEA